MDKDKLESLIKESFNTSNQLALMGNVKGDLTFVIYNVKNTDRFYKYIAYVIENNKFKNLKFSTFKNEINGHSRLEFLNEEISLVLLDAKHLTISF